ncbi:MAG: GNAT family N-acetyltransferase [Asgard group archaeon]|nr:GNAT family N-acetyltransferase [Asgard group archaeon]
MVDITIRKMIKEDIDPCVKMTITSFPWTTFGLKYKSAEKFFLDRLESDNKEVYVAIFNQEVVGFIAIKKDILFANYIRRIVVREDIRSKGIGAMLMKFIEELTLESGLPNVFLITTTVNKKAVEFYEKNGYKIIGTLPDFIKLGIDEYIFWKTKGPVDSFNVYD